MSTLAIIHRTAIPLREISALTVRAGASGPELLAVGDEDFAIVSAELDEDGRPAGTWRYNLWRVLPDEILDSESGSGFEGIASDGESNILVLQEEESRLLVLSADATELLGIVALRVPEETPGYGATWRDEPNERAEGLLLLADGHILVCKQKNPACLIEFGPEGDDPLGVGPDTLDPSAAFAYDGGELVALAAWPLADDTADALPSLNDLAADADGRVYAVSSAARAVARFESRLRPQENAHAAKTWKIEDLPGGEKAKPEGLTLVTGGRPAIGIDSKLAGDNLVLLDARF